MLKSIEALRSILVYKKADFFIGELIIRGWGSRSLKPINYLSRSSRPTV